MEKLGWRDRRISPDSGSLFQTFLKDEFLLFVLIALEFIVQSINPVATTESRKLFKKQAPWVKNAA
ncbi:hypothetical protein IRZ65_24980 [Pseudomonas zeshuii]|uniref:Uncharacterized protein n=2 Tax=Pseudomonas luteola TaxID=47886 RepID=A0ABS0FU74_PSELU|nr:hypothetical protein [Pseudomonas zeshuii]